jgi:hypothetical protein
MGPGIAGAALAPTSPLLFPPRRVKLPGDEAVVRSAVVCEARARQRLEGPERSYKALHAVARNNYARNRLQADFREGMAEVRKAAYHYSSASFKRDVGQAWGRLAPHHSKYLTIAKPHFMHRLMAVWPFEVSAGCGPPSPYLGMHFPFSEMTALTASRQVFMDSGGDPAGVEAYKRQVP